MEFRNISMNINFDEALDLVRGRIIKIHEDDTDVDSKLHDAISMLAEIREGWIKSHPKKEYVRS